MKIKICKSKFRSYSHHIDVIIDNFKIMIFVYFMNMNKNIRKEIENYD